MEKNVKGRLNYKNIATLSGAMFLVFLTILIYRNITISEKSDVNTTILTEYKANILTIDSLNQVLTKQDAQIIVINDKLAKLVDKLEMATASRTIADSVDFKSKYSYWYVNFDLFSKEGKAESGGMCVLKLKSKTFNPILASESHTKAGKYSETGKWVKYSMIQQVSEYDHKMYRKTYNK